MSTLLNPDTSVEIMLPDTINANYQLPDPELLQIYEDRKNRTIWVLGDIGEETYDWVDFIFRCNREDKGKSVEERKPIKLIVANIGGSAEAAKTLIEVISLSKTPVHGYAIGMCASAASQIFLACHKRYALPNCTFVFHNGSCNNLSGNFSELNAFMEDYRRDIKQLSAFYKSHTTFAPELIDDKLEKGDWYIYLDEALKNGVVDETITDIDMLL